MIRAFIRLGLPLWFECILLAVVLLFGLELEFSKAFEVWAFYFVCVVGFGFALAYFGVMGEK